MSYKLLTLVAASLLTLSAQAADKPADDLNNAPPNSNRNEVLQGISKSLGAQPFNPGTSHGMDVATPAVNLLEQLTGSGAHHGCDRWLYNPSGYTWRLIPEAGVDMCKLGGQCVARPYMGATINYPSLGDGSVSFRLQAFIADDNNVDKPKKMLLDTVIHIHDEPHTTCVHIAERDVAHVATNSPSEGDIVACGSGFDHAADWNHLKAYQACNFDVPELTVDQISERYRLQTPKLCADRTFEDGITFDKDHCAKHGGICRIGCDMPPARPANANKTQ
jgi:hypothetical protein